MALIDIKVPNIGDLKCDYGNIVKEGQTNKKILNHS